MSVSFFQFMSSWVRGVPLSQRVSETTTRTTAADTSRTSKEYSTFALPDGAILAYEVFGLQHLGHKEPIVLIPGMSALRTDFERLTRCLIKTRPGKSYCRSFDPINNGNLVLVYDHRGMGHSTSSPLGNEVISIELLAQDLAALLIHLKWEKVAICGYSMGGVVAQQMLVLPDKLPFRTTHLILAGTRSVVQSVGLRLTAPPPNKPRTPAERREIARRVVASLLDPVWIKTHPERFESLYNRAVAGLGLRKSEIIGKQGEALQNFNFADALKFLPREMRVMVVHGRLDQVIPFYCGEDVLKRIPWARLVEQGNKPGQVPSLDFGHYWFEYFDIQVWHDVVEKFLDN